MAQKTVEFEVGYVSGEDVMWDLRLAPELVEFTGMLTYGPEGAESEMPQFHSGRSSSTMRLLDNRWVLVSMQTPWVGENRQVETKRLVFVKVQQAR